MPSERRSGKEKSMAEAMISRAVGVEGVDGVGEAGEDEAEEEIEEGEVIIEMLWPLKKAILRRRLTM